MQLKVKETFLTFQKFYAGKNIDEFSVKFEREMKMVNQARYLSEFE